MGRRCLYTWTVSWHANTFRRPRCFRATRALHSRPLLRIWFAGMGKALSEDHFPTLLLMRKCLERRLEA